ncbi:MAG: hypothetical protein RL623_323 [Actinomycetota bacterium]
MAPIISGFVIANSVSEQWSPVSIICAVISIVSVMLMFTAEYGALHVQAGAYGSERRFLLRVPVALLLPLMLAWAALSASLVVFDELINRQNLVGSLIAGVISALLLWQLTPRIHRLSKRWLVRVPAGWVIHDGMMLAENLLIRSHNVSSISLALHGTEALDLSGVTPGVPYEIQLREMSDVRLSKLGSQLLKTMDVLHVKALLVATSRTPLN